MNLFSIQRLFIASAFLFAVQVSYAQNIRPYTQVFSENLKGGTVIFGNTSMEIKNGLAADLTKMNETSVSTNTAGGIGFSNYGNDGENMQPSMRDAPVASLTVFNTASNWRHNITGTDQGTAWRTLTSPSNLAWPNGTAPFGFGMSQTTTIASNIVTHYFLKTVNIASPGLYTSFNFTISYNDGAVVYVNGVEVRRLNMPAGTVSFGTLASTVNTTTNQTLSVPSSYFTPGNNVIAVEVHQQVQNSTDCIFDMSLAAPAFLPSNATMADLILPAGTNTIRFARLYYGGRVPNTFSTDTLRRIKIRKGNSGAYTSMQAPAAATDIYPVTPTENIYQSYIDIRDFIQTNGAGTYTIADVPETAGAVFNGGNFGGWCIMIAYENTSMPYNSIRIYDGFTKVYDSGTPVTQSVHLTGLSVPNNPLSLGDAILSTMVWEGDANLGGSASNPQGDYLKINNINVSNAVNPIANFWNGTVSKNGAFVTTKDPNYSNQMGIDIDELQVGTGYNILPNATSIDFEFGTEADQYFPSVFGFAIRMKDPLVTLDKTVVDASGNNLVESNEVLTYTLSGSNLGVANAYNTSIIDYLPANATYVPNSLKINFAPGCPSNAPQTDAEGDDFAFISSDATGPFIKFYIGTGATPSSGGTMGAGESYSVSLKLQGLLIPAAIVNTARVTSVSQAGDVFTDDGTALIAPSAALPVKMSSFTVILKDKNNSLLNWTTENELNNDHFDIERSEDGINFIYRGTVAGNGTTSNTHHYAYTDLLNTNAAIVYYRLRIVDLSGRSTFSKIVALRLKGNADEYFSIYPNPFTDHIKVLLKADADAQAQYRILSFDGKEIMNRKTPVQRGDNLIILKDLQGLPSGSYLLEVNVNGQRMIRKIMKK